MKDVDDKLNLTFTVNAREMSTSVHYSTCTTSTAIWAFVCKTLNFFRPVQFLTRTRNLSVLYWTLSRFFLYIPVYELKSVISGDSNTI